MKFMICLLGVLGAYNDWTNQLEMILEPMGNVYTRYTVTPKASKTHSPTQTVYTAQYQNLNSQSSDYSTSSPCYAGGQVSSKYNDRPLQRVVNTLVLDGITVPNTYTNTRSPEPRYTIESKKSKASTSY